MTKNLRFAAAIAALVAIPAAAAAAGDASGGSGPNWIELGSAIFNFSIYIGLIVLLGRKPIASFYSSRRAAVLASVEASKMRTEAAEDRLAETMDRLAKFDSERERIIAEFRDIGHRERDKIVAQARADAEKIVSDAEAAADRELKRAKADLEARLVHAAIDRAEAHLQNKAGATLQAKLIDDGIETMAGIDRQAAS